MFKQNSIHTVVYSSCQNSKVESWQRHSCESTQSKCFWEMMNFFLVYDLKFKWLWKLMFIIYRLCTRFNLYINMLLKKKWWKYKWISIFTKRYLKACKFTRFFQRKLIFTIAVCAFLKRFAYPSIITRLNTRTVNRL